MRPYLLLLPLLSLPASLLAQSASPDIEVKLQQLRDIGTLPEDKLALRPEEKLDTRRPNPFAERAKAKEEKTVETVETEEIKIRRIFDTLKITGISKFNGQYTALLGDLIIDEGAKLPPVIPGQTQILRVTKVTDKEVQIVWVEGNGYENVAPRRIVKRIELDPRVGVLLAGQPAGTTDSNAMAYLDENGKVIWPKKMAPDLDSMMDHLASPTSTANLSPDEEAALMQPAPGMEPAPPMPDPGNFQPSSSREVPVDPGTGIEDDAPPSSLEDISDAPDSTPVHD